MNTKSESAKLKLTSFDFVHFGSPYTHSLARHEPINAIIVDFSKRSLDIFCWLAFRNGGLGCKHNNKSWEIYYGKAIKFYDVFWGIEQIHINSKGFLVLS